MEPVSLTIGSVVAALILKATGQVGEQVTESGLKALGGLLERVRARFQYHADPAGEAALVRVLDPPTGPRQLEALAAAVDRHADEDPAFAEELWCLFHEAKSAGIDVQRVTQTAGGSQISQIQDVSDSTITVTFGHTPRS